MSVKTGERGLKNPGAARERVVHSWQRVDQAAGARRDADPTPCYPGNRCCPAPTAPATPTAHPHSPSSHPPHPSSPPCPPSPPHLPPKPPPRRGGGRVGRGGESVTAGSTGAAVTTGRRFRARWSRARRCRARRARARWARSVARASALGRRCRSRD